MIRYFYLILILSFLSCEKDDLDELIVEDVVEEVVEPSSLEGIFGGT